MIRLIVFDLETTLVSESNQIAQETLGLLSELKQKDIQFAVVTGRNYDSVYPLFEKLKDDVIYICNDGGSIIYQDQVLSKTPIDRLVCLDIEKEITQHPGYDLSYATERGLYITGHEYDFIKTLKAIGAEPEVVKDSKELHGDITKITIYAKNGFDEKSFEYFYSKWEKSANVAISNPNQIDITASYVHKASALALIQQIFDITAEDTVIFGGGYSDIEMFQYSYFSYAMQYADAEVKRSAQYIAENVDTILEDILRIR